MYRQPTNDQTHLTAYNSILVFWFLVSSALYYTPLLIKFFFWVDFMYVCLYVHVPDVCLYDFVMLNYGNNSVLVSTVKLCIDGSEQKAGQFRTLSLSNNTIASVSIWPGESRPPRPNAGPKSSVFRQDRSLGRFLRLFPGYLHKSAQMISLLFPFRLPLCIGCIARLDSWSVASHVLRWTKGRAEPVIRTHPSRRVSTVPFSFVTKKGFGKIKVLHLQQRPLIVSPLTPDHFPRSS